MQDKLIKILVIDDDHLDQQIIKRSLIGSGIKHEIFFADDHESGMEAIHGKKYDCILFEIYPNSLLNTSSILVTATTSIFNCFKFKPFKL